MTQLDDAHFELHSANKDRVFQKKKEMLEYKEAYVVVKSEAMNKDLDMHPMYRAEDATVVFKNKHNKLHKVNVPELIQIYEKENSVK